MKFRKIYNKQNEILENDKICFIVGLDKFERLLL